MCAYLWITDLARIASLITHFSETEIMVNDRFLWFKFDLATLMYQHTVLGYKVV